VKKERPNTAPIRHQKKLLVSLENLFPALNRRKTRPYREGRSSERRSSLIQCLPLFTELVKFAK
jgi:hypothetical protein